MLKTLPYCAHRAVEVLLCEVVSRRDVRVGTVESIQTLGSRAGV